MDAHERIWLKDTTKPLTSAMRKVQTYLRTPAGERATERKYVCNWPIEKLEAVVVDVGPHKGMTIGGLSADYCRELLAKEKTKGPTKDLRQKVIYLEELKPSPASSPQTAVAASANARAAPATPMREGGTDEYGGGGGVISVSLAPVKKEEEGRGQGKATPPVRPMRVKKVGEKRYAPVRVKREGKGQGSGEEGMSFARELKKEEGGGGGGGGGESSRAPPRKRMRVKKEEKEPVVILPGEPFQVNPDSVL